MAGYGRVYAGVYNQKWTGFANRVAPYLYDYITAAQPTPEHRRVLDIGCGTGDLLLYFLDRGYEGVGIDLSVDMLRYAEEHCRQHVDSGRVVLLQADARSFTLETSFDVALATFDMLNQMADIDELRQTFRAVRDVLTPAGLFLFDLVTRQGMYRWNIIEVDDSEGSLVISRGVYDHESDKAHYRITGFAELENGLYERFDETGTSTVFDLEQVRVALLETGWGRVHFARLEALGEPLEAPDKENRVFVVAGPG